MKQIFKLSFLILLLLNACSKKKTTEPSPVIEPGKVVWEKTFGDSLDDVFYDVVQTSDGGYLAVGSSEFRYGSAYGWALKTDGDGNKLWSKTYNEIGASLSCVIKTTGNNYLAAGKSGGNGWLMKLDGSGSLLADKKYSGISTSLSSVIETPDGGYLAVGMDGSIIKVSSNLEPVWNKATDDFLYAVVKANGGGYLMSGWTIGDSLSDGALLVRIDDDGNRLWRKTYGNGSYDEFNSLTAVADGYLASGQEEDMGGEAGAWLVKVNNDGGVVWEKTYSGTADKFYSVTPVNSGDYLLAGKSEPDEMKDGLIIAVRSDGSQIWEKTYGGAGKDWFYSIIPASQSGYVAAGHYVQTGIGSRDGWLMKVTP